MKGSGEWKTGKIMYAQPRLIGKYRHLLNIEPEMENENPVCIKWDHVDQSWELTPVREELGELEHVVFPTSEQKKANEGIDAKKREI